MTTATLRHADCLDALRELDDNSVDSVVTDPPYGLAALPSDAVTAALTAWISGDREHVPAGKGFMGKSWDGFVPPPAVWDEVIRVLKPGGHLLAFAGSRTQDLMGISIRMAGFEIRDSIAWLYGTGWPKSLDVSKGIDKAAGATRVDTGIRSARHGGGIPGAGSAYELNPAVPNITAPATDDARTWDGWGTALKPAHEPIIMARKPLAGTVVANVLAHGTGALNIGANRIPATDKSKFPTGIISETEAVYGAGKGRYADRPRTEDKNPAGRWPANVILDEDQAAELDAQSGITTSPKPYLLHAKAKPGIFGQEAARSVETGHGDSGGASRFFYVAKAPKSERPDVNGVRHPTVKPITLMRHLVRLVTPAGGTVLEPFAGSGATVEAALLEGFNCLAIEREADYIPLIEHRIERATPAALAA